MKYIEIEGGRPLQGEIAIQGSKNAALPMMAAALLTNQPVSIGRCPDIEDVHVMCELLQHIGAQITWRGDSVRIQMRQIQNTVLPEALVRKMRSSIMLLGPLLARTGRAEMTFPGGCVIGSRPIDLHLAALQQRGFLIEEKAGCLIGRKSAEHAAQVCRIHLRFPSVGATENILMNAVLGSGQTILSGAAVEPEVTALAMMLRQMGARIEGIGSQQLSIQAVPYLHGIQTSVMADRIVAGTYLLAAAATKGDIWLHGARAQDNRALLHILEEMGCEIEDHEKREWIHLKAPAVLKPVDVRTDPYPGFATDLQAMLMIVMTQTEGISHIEETIFENRFRHVEALRRIGARIQVHQMTAAIHGATRLQPGVLWATDLRAGAAMVLAGLCASGHTQIRELSHIERGYEDIVRDLQKLGAVISVKSDE